MALDYPAAARSDHVDVLHGVTVADPYRWLEDPDSTQTQAFIAAQNALTRSALDGPERERIAAHVRSVWDFERRGVPVRRGGRLFFQRQPGLRDQPLLCVEDAPGESPRVLLDPIELSGDGTVAVTQWSPSPDGTLVAYALSSGGSDWNEIRVCDVATGAQRDDVIRWVKYSGATWAQAADGTPGFYYGRYDPPAEGAVLSGKNTCHRVYFHTLGTDQAADRLVYERPDHPQWGFAHHVTEDKAWLVLHVWRGTDPCNGLLVRRLAGGPWIEVKTAFAARWDYLGSQGDRFWLLTDEGAPNRRVVCLDVGAGPVAAAASIEIVPETTAPLRSASIVGDRLVLHYLEDAHSVIRLYTLDGAAVGSIPLPGLGTIEGLAGRQGDRETFFRFSSFVCPPVIQRYDLDSGVVETLHEADASFDSERFETRQVWYTSRDGVRVPMFVTARADVRPDGERPTFLSGYGGFSNPMTPLWSTPLRVWLELGGVLAVANLRGGDEYGEAWHRAGMRADKQTVFDDFIAAGEHLIASGWTRSGRLAIGGGSNGGLLVTACANQRPELFGAVLAMVPVTDMLRFHRFTIGWAWQSEYGSPDDPEDFQVLRRYSPLHNVIPGAAYPPMLLLTGDHDDRVVPAHAYKLTAALQAVAGGDAPILLRVDTRAGHGHGKPTSKVIDEVADRWAFVARSLGMTVRLGG